MTDDRRNRNAILFLGPDEIKGLITMEEAVAAIAQGYREADEFPIGNAPRRRVHSPEGVRVSNFPGGIPGLGVIGSLTRAEMVAHEDGNQNYPYREHPVYLLWDSKTARLDGMMMGEIFDERVGFSSVMAFRTGATTGVGVDALARKDAGIFGLLGSGGQDPRHQCGAGHRQGESVQPRPGKPPRLLRPHVGDDRQGDRAGGKC